MIFDKGVQNEPADPQPEPTQTEERQNIPAQPDRALTRDFLNGDYCLRGVSNIYTIRKRKSHEDRAIRRHSL